MPELVRDLGMLFPHETSKFPKRYGLYICECGTTFKAMTQHVKSGRKPDCGHSEWQVKHGMTGTRLATIFDGMIQRTTNPLRDGYKYYGGKGITICDEWLQNRKLFFDWALSNGYESHLTIDRIENNKGYEPSNCRWTTMKEQCENRDS